MKARPRRARAKPSRVRRGKRIVAERGHLESATALAAEALRTGVIPSVPRKRNEIPHEDETMRVGDPDDSGLANEYVGENVPGGSTPTPDQNDVDEIGRVYGVQEEDSGSLRTSSEVLDQRDRHRQELVPPRRRP